MNQVAHHHWPRSGIAILLAAGMLVRAPVLAADPPNPAPTTVGTTRAASPAAAAKPAGQLQVRVYEGFGTLGPVYGAGDGALAVDVAVGLATCPDGHTEIGTMNIGGWRYDVAGTCSHEAARGSITVRGTGPRDAVVATREPGAAQRVIRCDPAAWRCAPATAP